MHQSKKYQRCLVMAGGGFHFGYYLGIYAALREAGQQPDILLASCGGAIAATLIQRLPDDAARLAWLQSREMYQFWNSLQSTPNARVTHAFAGALRRRFFGHAAKSVPDLFNDYMFEIPARLPLPQAGMHNVDVAIVAGKLNFTEAEVGQLRGKRKLFTEVLFCAERAATLVESLPAPLSAASYPDNAIAEQLVTDSTMMLEDAVRASISDMYYFRCHSHDSAGDYIGGVVDLFPIEIAKCLADSVIMELKGGYDEMYGIPAIRTVLGFDGNQRLQAVLSQHADVWVDTADMDQVFQHQRIAQKILWFKNKIQIVTPPTLDEYVQTIEAQWRFGYQRAQQGLTDSAAQMPRQMASA